MPVPPVEPKRTPQLTLSGQEASQWMAEQGMQIVDPGENFRLFADHMQVRNVTITRLYHTARRLIRVPSGDGVRITIVADGQRRVGARSQWLDVTDGAAYAHASTETVNVEMERANGTIEISLDAGFTVRFGLIVPSTIQLASPDSGATRILMATVLATLNSGPTATEESWRRVRDMIENGAAALMSDVRLDPVENPSATDQLLHRANEVIEINFHDENFNVQELCARLAISSTHLYRAYSTIGTTPLNEIRRKRVEFAQQIILQRESRAGEDKDAIARLAGFKTWRAFKDTERLLEKRI